MPELDVQLRREDGGLLHARTVAEAMKMAGEDSTIWKVSWTDNITDERIRLVRKEFTQKGTEAKACLWIYEPIVV